MGVYYYFYKEKDDVVSFNDGGYAGIPLCFEKYNLETYNPECDNCEKKDNKLELTCYGCFDYCKVRYKITKDKIPNIIKDMRKSRQHLFEELIEQSKQDYIWMYIDF